MCCLVVSSGHDLCHLNLFTVISYLIKVCKLLYVLKLILFNYKYACHVMIDNSLSLILLIAFYSCVVIETFTF